MSEGMGYHAERGELDNCKEDLEREIKFHKGELTNMTHLLYRDNMTASAAAEEIRKFTEAWPDPFLAGSSAPSLNYPYSNPWGNKKDNKGKKDRPAGAYRPAKVAGGVSL